MDWIRAAPIAHRGLHDATRGRPENSLAAFEAAAEAGYPVEFDVRLTSDGVVVVFHDDNLLRMTGCKREVGACSLGELAGLGLGGTGERIPTLTEALDLVDGRVPLFIELKNYAAPGPLEEAAAAELQAYRGRWAVGSFNPMSLGWFKEHVPDVHRGQISGSLADSDLHGDLKAALSNLAMNGLSEPHFVGYELDALPHPAVTAAREGGLPIVAYTVRTDADRRKAADVADNFIFEGIRP